MTRDLGVGGNLFGGTMMAWMDEAAGIYAHVYTSEPRMVTLKYAELIFKYPVRERDRVDFYAGNVSIGNTSITFDIEGRVGKHVVFKTTGTFVAIEENGRPKALSLKTAGMPQSVED
jgi:acyl-CoA thioesterase YciA